jgi:hypothetical protein
MYKYYPQRLEHADGLGEIVAVRLGECFFLNNYNNIIIFHHRERYSPRIDIVPI